MAPTTATTTSANPTLTATPAHEAARACLDGLQALPRRPPVALAGSASAALSFGRTAGGVANAASGRTGRGGATQKRALDFHVPR